MDEIDVIVKVKPKASNRTPVNITTAGVMLNTLLSSDPSCILNAMTLVAEDESAYEVPQCFFTIADAVNAMILVDL